MVQKAKCGMLRRKNSDFPSGAISRCDSKSPVEITPGMKSSGSGFDATGPRSASCAVHNAAVTRHHESQVICVDIHHSSSDRIADIEPDRPRDEPDEHEKRRRWCSGVHSVHSVYREGFQIIKS